MNDTAKKLREAANYMADSGANSAHAIATVRGLFDVVESDTFGGDLGRVLNVIADELDELQAKANEANNLRQQLESAEKKAERRKQHIEYLETALHDKNALLEQRGGTIARLTAENGELRKQVPSERERQILDMWPRFEDGEPVMFGDRFIDHKANERTVRSVIVNNDGVELRTFDGTFDWHETGERLKRPAPKVLDADGVEIKVGDTVWYRGLCTMGSMRKATVIGFDENSLDVKLATLKDEAGKTWCICPEKITHVQPDSWEQLESDAALPPGDYVDKRGRRTDLYAYQEMPMDLIRRAKALAGVEVDE